MLTSPFRIELFDNQLRHTGWLNDPSSLVVTPKHMGLGTATITVPDNHRRLDLLDDDKGDRVVITYGGEFLMSGVVEENNIEGPNGQAEIIVNDDFYVLRRMLGWPVPGAAINAQGVKEDTRTGPAETVAKGFISANLPHMIDGSFFTVMPDQMRGSTITAKSRMKPLEDILAGPCDVAGIGLQVRQIDGRLQVDAYTSKVFPHELSVESGTILSYKRSSKAPTATRAITGGPNEGTSREFRRVTSLDREAALGYTIEAFVDAQSADSYAAQDLAGNNALDDAAAKFGFSLTLSESAAFRYGGPNGVHVGDLVTVNIGGAKRTDVLREATLSFTPENGLVITPTIGERTDDTNRNLGTFLAAVKRRLIQLGTR